MSTQKITHTAKKKKEFELDLQYILRRSGMDLNEYRDIFFERAIQFVYHEFKRFYPSLHEEKVHQFCLDITTQEMFWSWWQLNYQTRDNWITRNIMGDPAFFLRRHNQKLFRALYHQYNDQYNKENHLHNSFYHLLESLK